MTSAITRAPAGAAHAHGFAKSLKGDAPAEGFEALFAAVAGAQPSPVTPPVIADGGKGAEQKKAGEGANDDDATASSAQLVAAMMTFVAPDVKVVDPRTSPASANSVPNTEKAPMGSLESRGPIEIGNTDSTPPTPASQTFVPNAAFVILDPAAHALIAHKGRIAESPATPTADSPRSARAPIVAQTAASSAPREPEHAGHPAQSHVESKPLSTAPPSTSPHTPVERTRNELSPRALVQAAMVEIVRSPGRGRLPTPEAANNDTQDAMPPPAQPDAAMPPPMPVASSAPVASAPVSPPSIFEQAGIVETELPIANPSPAAKPNPTSRAAADIARQRQFVLGSNGDSSPAESDSSLTGGAAFETAIALHKADETLEDRAPAASSAASVSSAAPSGAWLGNVPGSSTSTLNAAAAVATPRAFDQAAWSAALAQQVTASVIAATRETTVRIKPDGLGPIEVRVRIEAQHVDVRFAIEHPVTVNMVREALPDLQRMLAQSGLNLGDAEVAQQNAGSRGQATRSGASSSQSAEDELATSIGDAVESRPRVRVGLLDDFV
jgi:flagellar hook-length control protein FliK